MCMKEKSVHLTILVANGKSKDNNINNIDITFIMKCHTINISESDKEIYYCQ
jgi:hypothetical protein